MAVIYDTSVKAARMDATRSQVVGGTLELGTAGMSTVLASFKLAAGSVDGPKWTIAFVESTVEASAKGEASEACIKDAGGKAKITGLTVGKSGADIELSSVTISAGQNVTLSSAKITHA